MFKVLCICDVTMRYVMLSGCQVDFELINGSVKVTVKHADAYFSYVT